MDPVIITVIGGIAIIVIIGIIKVLRDWSKINQVHDAVMGKDGLQSQLAKIDGKIESFSPQDIANELAQLNSNISSLQAEVLKNTDKLDIIDEHVEQLVKKQTEDIRSALKNLGNL